MSETTTTGAEHDLTAVSAEAVPADVTPAGDLPATPIVPAEPTLRAADLLVQEGDIAGDYLERLLDIADVDGDIDMDVEGERAIVAVVGEGLQVLVGSNGEVLDALQELTRLAVVQQTGTRSRLMLDIGGWRADRKTELAAVGTKAAERCLETAEPVRLAAMTPFERKVVHDAVAAVDGVRSESEGVEPERRVVVLPGA